MGDLRKYKSTIFEDVIKDSFFNGKISSQKRLTLHIGGQSPSFYVYITENCDGGPETNSRFVIETSFEELRYMRTVLDLALELEIKP